MSSHDQTLVTCNPSCVHGSCMDTNMCACEEGYKGDSCNTTGENSLLL